MKPFNLYNIIQDRVNKEALQEWALRNEKVSLPAYQKSKKVKLTAGLYNFLREMLP